MFGLDSVCAWKVKSTSDFYFNKKIKIDIKNSLNTECYVANGDSLTTATQYVACEVGDSYEFDAD